MQISLEGSQKIRNMSLVCAGLVVSIHTSLPAKQALSLGWFIYELVGEGIARIAVPFFFVVSGFFLAQHFDEKGWWRREAKKRIQLLVVPFVLWSVITLVATTPLSIIADILAHRPLGASIYWANNILRFFGLDLTEYPGHIPLWYVRSLFLFVLTSGLFKWGVGRFKWWWIGLVFMLSLVQNYFPNDSWRDFFLKGYSADGIVYFSFGVFIKKSRPQIEGRKFAIGCAIVAFGLLALKLVFDYNGYRGGFIIAKMMIPFFLYLVWDIMPSNEWPKWLTSCSFPIFLIHPLLLAYYEVVLKHLPASDICVAFISFAGSIAGAIVITLLLRNYTPKLANILFGGR